MGHDEGSNNQLPIAVYGITHLAQLIPLSDIQ